MTKTMTYKLQYGEIEMTFKKYGSEETGMVNIYIDGHEIDCFTDYTIGTNMEVFRESCKEHLQYLIESGQL